MIKAIAFDLDDTLLNTSGLLAPKATSDAFQLLIKADLKLSPAECEKHRQELVKTLSHREVFEKLALEFGTEQTREALPEVIRSFYEPQLPQNLPLLEGARENIDYLKNRYQLYLVTAGAEKSQMAKVNALGILHDFKKVFVVNSVNSKRKKDVFQTILVEQQLQNQELLCIGNSLLSEIKDAMSLGIKTCYFQFGEERGSLTELPQQPDFQIQHHKQLISTCQL